MESSNANFFVKRALTKPLLWRMIEVSDSYLACLTALTFPMADGPFGMWVQLVLQHACNSGDLEGKFPLDPLSREKSRPQAAHGIQQPRQLMYDGMTPCPHLIPSEPSPWCHGAAPERRSVIWAKGSSGDPIFWGIGIQYNNVNSILSKNQDMRCLQILPDESGHAENNAYLEFPRNDGKTICDLLYILHVEHVCHTNKYMCIIIFFIRCLRLQKPANAVKG